MPNDTDIKQSIVSSIERFSSQSLGTAALALFQALGYRSDKRLTLHSNSSGQFIADFDRAGRLNQTKALVSDWRSFDFLFQLTDEEIQAALTPQGYLFANHQVDQTIIKSYLFFAIHLSGEHYTRTQLAAITREVNKLWPMPVMILFQHGPTLTLSIIARRLNKRDPGKDVLEKVTLIKDISVASPHRAHIEILFDLSIEQLCQQQPITNFVELQRAWERTLDTAELNKKFYREVADWYFWAVKNVEFPHGGVAEAETRNATSVIRLITRLIFIWFMKEKGLVPEDLFDPRRLKDILNYSDAKNSTYYKAILQNLFFATLNTEMGEGRRFRGKNRSGGMDAHYGIASVYRYQDYFKDPQTALQLFGGVPFLNGGLFECLDKREEKILVDGFSDDPRNQPVVPDTLFFGDEHIEDLSEIYGDQRHSREKVRGLIHIFNSYKFTIEENTPVEEEIALDPELLGKVFENLLAAYNPETGVTARKQTGSFYTPREIINYMVDEALIAYLESKLEGAPDPQPRLRHLLAYNNEPHQFTEAEEQRLISAIDAIKVLDPACGSGAFPMGVLHKLVFILNKLDPGNVHWKEKQIAKAAEIPDPNMREWVIEDIDQAFNENELDYGRKLYLIENCIYGVDIQPIAVQIAKLRFFISLVVDQRIDRSKPNLGIRPLPNLETKFVAANTLIGIERPPETSANPKPPQAISADIKAKCEQLVDNFRQYLKMQNPKLREKYLNESILLGEEINQALSASPGWTPVQVSWIFNTAKSVEVLRDALPLERPQQAAAMQLHGLEVQALEDKLADVRDRLFNAHTPATKRKYRELDKQLRSQIATLLKTDGWGSTAAAQLAGWDPYDQNTSAGFFEPEWMFGVSGGFNVVIGNPPYIRASNLSEYDRNIYRSKYRNAIGAYDIYILFIARALRMVNTNGIVTLITPNKLFIADYASRTRQMLTDEASIIEMADFGKCRSVFEGVLISTAIIFFTTPGKKGKTLLRILNDDNAKQVMIVPTTEIDMRDIVSPDGAFLVYSNDLSNTILTKVYEDSEPLSLVAQVRTGIMGFDYWAMADFISDDFNGRRIVTNSYVDRFVFLWGKKINLYKKEIYNPRLAPNCTILSPNTIKLFESRKIIVRGVAKRLTAVWDDEGFGILVAVHSVIGQKHDNKFLLALLNSKLFNWIHLNQFYSAKIPEGSLRYPISFLSNLPIKIITTSMKSIYEEIINVTNKIIQIKKQKHDADTCDLERQLNNLIYEIYGLSKEEIQVIDNQDLNVIEVLDPT